MKDTLEILSYVRTEAHRRGLVINKQISDDHVTCEVFHSIHHRDSGRLRIFWTVRNHAWLANGLCYITLVLATPGWVHSYVKVYTGQEPSKKFNTYNGVIAELETLPIKFQKRIAQDGYRLLRYFKGRIKPQ